MTTETKTGLLEGARRKAEQLANLEARREWIVNRARRTFIKRLLETGTATADDVRSAIELPDGIDPRCLGAVPGPLAKAGIIRRAGFSKSERPERNASYISSWELLDRDKALAWLANHPDMPDPQPVVDPPAWLFN